MTWSVAELMAIVMARELRDGDVVVTGTLAAIPTAAYRSAQKLGASRLVAMNGALATIDPSAAVVPPSSADEELRQGRFNLDLRDVTWLQTRGSLDVVFLGALQVDRHGRCNLALIGDPERPTLRGPGTLGVSMMAVVGRSFMYLTTHDPRSFVEQVDFVSASGLRPGGGLSLVVTPIAVLGPDPSGEHLDLISVHPGRSVEEVTARTGFELRRDGVPETPAPSATELEALRSVDTAGVLRRLELG